MIVEFSVKNFRSIKDLQTISFVTTGLKSSEKNSSIDENNIAIDADQNLFKTIGIYGANASGKSNIIKALFYFIKTITREPSSESRMSNLCDPFYFQNKAEVSESFFQIVLTIDNKKFRYGFTVRKNHNEASKKNNDKRSDEIITNEWLYGPKEKNTVELFNRVNNKITNDRLPNKDKIPSLSYKHTLYITHAAAFDNSGACTLIRDYLMRFVVSNLESDHEDFRWLSIDHLNNNEEKKKFLNLLSLFNLEYDDITLQGDDEALNAAVFPQNKISLFKKFKIGDKTENINLNLFKNESSGTQKLFDLSGLLLRAFSLNKPAFIILDEIDRNFHPFLVIRLINFFNDPKINKSNSQLLFTSHDTNLMSPTIMRRDQFYFTEKKEDNSTRLYSLSDLKGIRNDADFAKQYLAGYYGALPVLEEYLHNEVNG